MDKIINWLENFGSSLLGFVILPFLYLFVGVCMFADIFVDSQTLTDLIKITNDIIHKLSDFDGSKDKKETK